MKQIRFSEQGVKLATALFIYAGSLALALYALIESNIGGATFFGMIATLAGIYLNHTLERIFK